MGWFNKKKKKVKLGNVTAKKSSNFMDVDNLPMVGGEDYNPEKMSRRKLRDKAFGLRYNPYVVRYLSVVESLMLGKEGFVLDFHTDTQTTRRLEREFKHWQTSVSTCGRYSLRALFATIVNDQLLGGEVFLEKVLLDGVLSYRLHQTLEEQYANEGIRVIDGIEYDQFNRPTSYKIPLNVLDSESDYSPHRFTSIDASMMIHVYSSKLTHEYRGTTALAPVINLIEKLQVFTDSILNQQIISASTSTVYEKVEEDADSFNTFDQDEDGKPVQPKPGEFKKTLNSQEVLVVPNGYKLTHSNFSHFSPSNSNYIGDVLKRISSGLLIPYHALSGDLKGANFSSLKFNSLLEDSHFQSMQTMYQRVYREIVIDFIKYKSLTDKFFDVDAMVDNIVIHPYKMPPLEPLKDAQVDELKLELGLTSKTKILADEGLIYEDILKDELKEKAVKELYK
jgi:capsid protein